MTKADFTDPEIRAYVTEQALTMNARQVEQFYVIIFGFMSGPNNGEASSHNVLKGVIDIVAERIKELY